MLQQKVNRSLLEKSTDSFGWVGDKATTSDSITGSNPWVSYSVVIVLYRSYDSDQQRLILPRSTSKVRADLSLPVAHFRGICLLGKRFHEARGMHAECCDRVSHGHAAPLRTESFDLHHDACGVRLGSKPDIFRSVKLPIHVEDGPNSFLAGTSLSKDGIAGELDPFWKHRTGCPILHPIPLALRTKKWEGHVGTARQFETSGTADPLCSTLTQACHF
jgi:hypothetical protein